VKVSLLVLFLLATFASPAFAQFQHRLNWVDNSDKEDGIIVERKGPTETVYTEIARLPANARAYDDLLVPSGELHCYRVKAFNVDGESNYSNTYCNDIPLGDPTPDAPTGLQGSGSKLP